MEDIRTANDWIRAAGFKFYNQPLLLKGLFTKAEAQPIIEDLARQGVIVRVGFTKAESE